MFVNMMKSKIHRATITETDLNYVGSITIDEELINQVGILENEKVQIININNGIRFETYVIKGVKGSGQICLNGAAARLAEVGDKIIIIAYCWLNSEEAKTFKSKVVLVDDNNKIIDKFC